MCRLLAIPSEFPRDKSLEIIDHFQRGNKDGFGYCYLNEKSEFVVVKFAYSFEDALKKEKDNLLYHLPYKNSFTLVHLRSKTHGEITPGNTHPFIIGEGDNSFTWIHNGVFSETEICRAALPDNINYTGETDTEVAGYLYAKIGSKRFIKVVENSGVFIALKKNGELEILNTSGDLELMKLENDKFLIASELSHEYKSYYGHEGIYQFNKNCEYKNFIPKNPEEKEFKKEKVKFHKTYVGVPGYSSNNNYYDGTLSRFDNTNLNNFDSNGRRLSKKERKLRKKMLRKQAKQGLFRKAATVTEILGRDWSRELPSVYRYD